MPSLRTPLRLALVALLVIPAAACGGQQQPAPSGDRPVLAVPDNPSVASAVADPRSPRIISVVVADGERTGDVGVVSLRRNVPVRLVVITDDADTLLVQGYDLRTLATADVPVQLDFVADQPGEFAVLLEDSGLELTRLKVA